MKSVKTIEAKFLRSKTAAKQTGLWKNASDNTKLVVLKQLSFNASEEPIIIFCKKEGFQWLLTNERLVISGNDKISSISISEIENVELKNIIEGRVSKAECSSIQLLIKNVYFDLEVEPLTWSIMFSILSFMIE